MRCLLRIAVEVGPVSSRQYRWHQCWPCTVQTSTTPLTEKPTLPQHGGRFLARLSVPIRACCSYPSLRLHLSHFASGLAIRDGGRTQRGHLSLHCWPLFARPYCESCKLSTRLRELVRCRIVSPGIAESLRQCRVRGNSD